MLPFSNLSRNPADDEIGYQIGAALRTAIMESAGLAVVTLEAGDEAAALISAEGRNALWLIGGGYQRIGDQVRVTGRLVTVPDGTLRDSVKLDGSVAALPELTQQLVASLGRQLGGARGPASADAGNRPATTRPGVAVARFTNISRNPSDDRIQGTIAAAVAGGLRELAAVSVVALEDADEASALADASARGAIWLVSGGYQQVGGQLRLTARLLDVASGNFIETVKVDGPVDQLQELLAEVVGTLRTALDARAATGVARLVAEPARKVS